MKIGFVFLAFLQWIPSSHAQDGWANCLTGDLWVVADYSGSMQNFESYVFEATKAIAHGVLSNSGRTRIGFIVFNEGYQVIQGLSSDLKEINQTLKSMKNLKASGGTLIKNALLGTHLQQRSAIESRFFNESGFKQMLILISDGEDGDVDSTLEYSKSLKAEFDWWIFSIFVKTNHHFNNTMNQDFEFLQSVSGNANEESWFIDSVILTHLPDYFREHFNCF